MKVQEIGAFEAKTKLSELLEKVQRGQVFHITKRGRCVAELRAYSAQGSNPSPDQSSSLSKRFAVLRSAVKAGPSAKELISEGRRG